MKVEGATDREVRERKHASGNFLASHYRGKTPPLGAIEAHERAMREADDRQSGKKPQTR
jgi:hypothetical protein